MQRIFKDVAGLDVHRDTVVACARSVTADGEVIVAKESFSTTISGLEALAEWLAGFEVQVVAMEATGVYWRPVYYVLEGRFDKVWLCNAHHVKNVPGRKTDLSDAEWLADVVGHGMIRPSVVPVPEMRVLRDLTRYRKAQVDERTREIQRLEKVLQDAGIKLSSVASRVWSKSAKAMVEALIAGEVDAQVLAELAKGKMRRKIPELEEALKNRFGEHHRLLCRRILAHIDFLDDTIEQLNVEIVECTAPLAEDIELLCSIPGWQRTTAEVFLAETGGNMALFPTARHLAAWTGVAPANRESAGKHRPAGTRKGSKWLRRTLIESARSAAKAKGTRLSSRYARIAARRGPNKAAGALANTMVVIAWHVLTSRQPYKDLGVDYYDKRRDPALQAQHLARKIQALGYSVTLHAPAA